MTPMKYSSGVLQPVSLERGEPKSSGKRTQKDVARVAQAPKVSQWTLALQGCLHGADVGEEDGEKRRRLQETLVALRMSRAPPHCSRARTSVSSSFRGSYIDGDAERPWENMVANPSISSMDSSLLSGPSGGLPASLKVSALSNKTSAEVPGIMPGSLNSKCMRAGPKKGARDQAFSLSQFSLIPFNTESRQMLTL